MESSEEIINIICNKFNLNKNDILIPKWGKKPQITTKDFIEALLYNTSGQTALESLGRSKQTFNRYIKVLFPEVTNSLNGGNETWKLFLVTEAGYKKCCSCKETLPQKNFWNSSERWDGLNDKCKSCNVQATALYRARKLQAVPKWADLDRIKEIYNNCPTGFEVDHEVPLNGINVCGLHVEYNLQYLTVQNNRRKSNKFGDVAKLVETRQT